MTASVEGKPEENMCMHCFPCNRRFSPNLMKKSKLNQHLDSLVVVARYQYMYLRRAE